MALAIGRTDGRGGKDSGTGRAHAPDRQSQAADALFDSRRLCRSPRAPTPYCRPSCEEVDGRAGVALLEFRPGVAGLGHHDYALDSAQL